MAELRATPMVNPVMGLLADRLKKVQQFGAKPFGYENPPVEMLMNLLGVPAVQQTMERMAYGEPLTTGRGMTTKPRAEAVEAAMAIAPVAGLLGKATKGLPVGASVKNVGEDLLSYRGSHKAPSPEFGAPLHDLTGGGQMYPADVYSSKAAQYYGTGYPKADKEAFDLAKKVRGNPDAEVTMYRAVPKDENIKTINAGDWVTLSKDYAKTHGESVLQGDYKIISQKVKAKDLWTNADSIHEFGYQPQKKVTAPQQEALDTAQKNAALPIEEGGLGLPKDNTPEMRAKAMGFDTPVYHGTNQDINIFNVEGKGKTSGAGAFFTTNPTAAETYVSGSGGGNILPLLLRQEDLLTANARGRNWADIYTNQLGAKAGKKRYSLEDLELDRDSATSTDELGIIASNLGLKGVEIKNVKDLGPNSHVMRAKEYLADRYGITPDETWSNVSGKQFDEAQKYMKQFYESQKGDIYAIQDPSLLRSRNAAFDPMRKNEADILAGVLPLGLLADEEQRKKIYELMPSLLGQ